MSGGYFDISPYQLEWAAEEIEHVIKNNQENNFSTKTITRFEKAVNTLRTAATMLNRVDYLLSYDDSEESFNKRWDDEISNTHSTNTPKCPKCSIETIPSSIFICPNCLLQIGTIESAGKLQKELSKRKERQEKIK